MFVSLAYNRRRAHESIRFQIVFVASNFVSDEGDVAIIDDIEIMYSNDGECADALAATTVAAAESTLRKLPSSTPVVAAAAPISAEPNPENVGIDDCHRTKCDFENGTGQELSSCDCLDEIELV